MLEEQIQFLKEQTGIKNILAKQLRYPSLGKEFYRQHFNVRRSNMAWRGSTTPLDRTFACLTYLVPVIDSLNFAAPFFSQFPSLKVVLLPLIPILQIYGSVPFASLIIFFALYLLVVRNESINHFIRFNAMQAILLSIITTLCGLVLQLFGSALGGGLVIETVYNVIFLGTIAAVVYSVAQSVLGRYAEIPTLSEAVHMQVR
jgi:hypothetical protein